MAHAMEDNTQVIRKRTGGGGGGPGGGGGNGPNGGAGRSKALLLEEDSEGGKHAKVSFSLKILIMKARTAKGMTQKQLAAKIREPVKTVNEYESGKTIPNNAILGKMERAMGCKLRGAPAKKKKKK